MRVGCSAAFLTITGYGRSHRILHFSTKCANGGLQSASVTAPEKLLRRVWVVLRPTTIRPLAFRSLGRKPATYGHSCVKTFTPGAAGVKVKQP
jgi:hypothetical protein